MELSAWAEGFAASTKRDHMDLMDYLSEMKNTQAITSGTLDKKMDVNVNMTRQLMEMMQTVGFRGFPPVQVGLAYAFEWCSSSPRINRRLSVNT